MTSANFVDGFLSPDAVPVLDVRLLSHSDLLALSASSSISNRRFDDSVIPKIDRSVFNESAGSRRQTYHRIRLAHRKLGFSDIRTANVRSGFSRSAAIGCSSRSSDVVSRKIIEILKELFYLEEYCGDNLIPVPLIFDEKLAEMSYPTHGLQEIPVHVTGNSQKRKRGRKSKVKKEAVINEGVNNIELSVVPENSECKRNRMTRKNGVLIEQALVKSMEDPYDIELSRMTQGLETESDLVRFLGLLNGKWGNWRRKSKIVNAADLSDLLPRGWRILICLKRNAGRASLSCSRYISPNDRCFLSYKEASDHQVPGDIRRVDKKLTQNCADHLMERASAASITGPFGPFLAKKQNT